MDSEEELSLVVKQVLMIEKIKIKISKQKYQNKNSSLFQIEHYYEVQIKESSDTLCKSLDDTTRK